MPARKSVIPTERIEQAIYLIRGQKVMLDADLAVLYGVETKALNLAVRRNLDRFPEDFMFRLRKEEYAILRLQNETSNDQPASEPANLRFQIETSSADPDSDPANLRYQFGTSNTRHGGRRYPPYAFTEQGVAMLSGLLNSPRAIAVNVEIMRAFVRLRQMLAQNADLSRKLDALERKYDRQFKVVFDAIRQLMAPTPTPTRRIGFRPPR